MKKICTKCKKSKGIVSFRRHKAYKNRYSWCRDCESTMKLSAYHRNPTAYNKRVVAYRKKDPKRWKEYAKKYKLDLKREVMDKYGGKCVCCGEKPLIFLTIDHIKGGGNKHRKELGRRGIYSWLRTNNYPKGFQVLCWNCNAAKHILGKCIHQVKVRT